MGKWGAVSSWDFRSALIDTPAPVIDLDIAERNIVRAQAICDNAGVANRPHIKTHKSVFLGRLQLKHGAAGITCQKLGEAEIMAAAGFNDILVSYNILGRAKHRRLATLNEKTVLTVSCDNAVVARDLSTAVSGGAKPLKVLVECDTGRHRCGVTSPTAAAELAGVVNALPGLAFSGLLMYPPNGETAQTRSFIDEVRTLCAEAGLSLETVSAGGTPNLAWAGQFGESEFRAGTNIFNDRQMVSLGACAPEDCALFVYATIVSHPEPGRVMIDAGSKTLTSELVGFGDYGELVDYPGASLYRFAEEHGFVDVSGCKTLPEVGEIVRVLPNHICPLVNLYDEIAYLRDGELAGRFAIDARGKVN